MNTLKTFQTLVVLLLLLTFPFVQADPERSQGLLWEISQPDAPVSYLFGTIHSEDPEVLRLAAPVQKALDASSAVVLEVLLDTSAMKAASVAMLMMDGRLLRDIVGESLFSRAAVAMQLRGMPEVVTDHMQPWAVAVTLSMPESKSGQVLDMVLYQGALLAGKQVYGLETIKEQLDVFSTMTLDHQLILLRDAVENFPEIDAIHEELLSAWKQRDLARLVEIGESAQENIDQGFIDDFEKRLITRRNYLMLKRMQSHLKQGRAFVAVGALHLPGEEGLLNLLEQLGYKIRVLY